ncbi:MAG: hypothetical protein U0359_14830 [Byssovorax sp.]
MPKSDRAFRSLARVQPDIIAGFLSLVAPEVLPPGTIVIPDDLAPTQVDALPPELDADFAARISTDGLTHLECQGYRDETFGERVLWYHVGLALRYRGKRRVRTIALWLTSPPKSQRRGEVTVDNIVVRVTTVVLQEVKASLLLSDPKMACFAAGADREHRSDEELCLEVAVHLRARNASWAERHLAVVAAAMQRRYNPMVNAMEQMSLEPVIIEDLVKFGEDLGFDKGRREEERATLRRVLALRKLPLGLEQEQQIDACADLATLRRWLDQAIFAATAAEALR